MKSLYKQVVNTNFEVAYAEDAKRYTWLISFELACMAMVVFIQYYVRVHYKGNSCTIQFLLGTLPSFLGAAGYMAIAFVFYKMILQQNQLYTFWKTIGGCFAVTVGGLTAWECIRTVLYPFDWQDVAMSVAGAGFASSLLWYAYKPNKRAVPSQLLEK